MNYAMRMYTRLFRSIKLFPVKVQKGSNPVEGNEQSLNGMMDEFILASQALNDGLTGAAREEKVRAYKDHIRRIFLGEKPVPRCPDLKPGLSWINTTKPLGIHKELKGRVILLDFFTYCCINCLHILPDLHELETEYAGTNKLVVVGVHSAKFPNEKVLSNIENAVSRYEISHPVVNDSEMTLWTQLQIQCWPTVVVLSPDGKVLHQFIGEGHKDSLFAFVECVMEIYGERISDDKLPYEPTGQTMDSILKYPSKIYVDKDRLIISDAGHNRLLQCDKQGRIMGEVGRFLQDEIDSHTDSYRELDSPQGSCVIGDDIYFTDSETHMVRKVTAGRCEVLVGTGERGMDMTGGQKGTSQLISSPWDIKPYSIDGDLDDPYMLLIAMSGTHQIWMYALKDFIWLKKRSFSAGHCYALVGSGAEENRNNSYPHKVGLAQPSGISIDTSKHVCYIADSESSTVRILSLKDGSVKNLVGGERDPMNLFSYGDVDGKGIDGKLQHPLDVCHIPKTDWLLVCDSYNHKIKYINLKNRMLKTLPISDLSEPGGISYDVETRQLYIADTNNHRIKVTALPENLDEATHLDTSELTIRESLTVTEHLFSRTAKSIEVVKLPSRSLSSVSSHITFTYVLPEGCYVSDEPESVFRADVHDISRKLETKVYDGKITPNQRISVPIPTLDVPHRIDVELLVYYCSGLDKTCRRKCILQSVQVF